MTAKFKKCSTIYACISNPLTRRFDESSKQNQKQVRRKENLKLSAKCAGLIELSNYRIKCLNFIRKLVTYLSTIVTSKGGGAKMLKVMLKRRCFTLFPFWKSCCQNSWKTLKCLKTLQDHNTISNSFVH